MTYYFENKNRYQVIFPYTSDKIHVEPDLDHGVHSCYQELKDRGVKTPVFLVYNMDSGNVYELEIPKYKDIQLRKPDNNNGQTINSFQQPAPNQTQVNQPMQSNYQIQPNPPQPNATQLNPSQTNPSQLNQPQPNPLQLNPPMQSVQIIQQPTPIDYDKQRHNELVTRLNHVEYQLEVLKKALIQKPKKEEEGCIIV